MDRIIKFRGIPVFGKDFVYGYYNVYKSEGKTKHEIITQENGVTRYEVDPKTVGQFTGLHDKNDVEIYGGDIVDYTLFDAMDNDTQYKGVIEFSGGVYWIETDGTSHMLYDVIMQDCELEVIVNIYENKSLLEVKEIPQFEGTLDKLNKLKI